MRKNVAIVGAGVSGLTCGVVFAEQGDRTAIFAAETGLRTTSAAAGAIWYPYDAAPVDLVITWSLETYQILRDLAHDSESGVSMIELRAFSRHGEIPIPAWAGALGARRLTDGEIFRAFASGFALYVPLTDTTIYLDYLERRFRAAGGEIKRNVYLEKLEDVNRDLDLIINCSGIGSRELAADRDLEAHRGQVAIVPKFELPHAVVCDDAPLMYAIPRTRDCLFGGTNQLSEQRDIDPADTSRIVAECCRVLQIKPPRVIAERVGLRPFRRSGVRVEAGKLRDGRLVIHNYGHGGAGFTLSWGCAESVLSLAAHLDH
jgi:D-amino-acid oxidase